MVREKRESRMALEVFPLNGCIIYGDGENWEDGGLGRVEKKSSGSDMLNLRYLFFFFPFC